MNINYQYVLNITCPDLVYFCVNFVPQKYQGSQEEIQDRGSCAIFIRPFLEITILRSKIIPLKKIKQCKNGLDYEQSEPSKRSVLKGNPPLLSPVVWHGKCERLELFSVLLPRHIQWCWNGGLEGCIAPPPPHIKEMGKS